MADDDGLHIFNFCIYCLTLSIAFITLIAMVFLKLYHGNLRILLINVSFNHCLVVILAASTEMFILYDSPWQGRKQINDLTSLSIWAIIFNILCLFLERMFASFYEKSYETMCIGIPWLGMCLVFFDWLMAFIFTLLPSVTSVKSLTLAITAMIIVVFTLVIFSFMPSITYKRYMYAINRLEKFTLSQRYQMSENCRSSKLLSRAVWVLGISSISGILFYIISKSYPSLFTLFNTLYSLSFVCQIVVYPMLVMYYEYKVRDFLLCRHRRNFVATTITGKNLIITSIEDQREAYFQSYRQAWA